MKKTIQLDPSKLLGFKLLGSVNGGAGKIKIGGKIGSKNPPPGPPGPP